MKVTECELPGVKVIEPRVSEDDRGFFLETFQQERYAEAGIGLPFVQDNHSFSKEGTTRGLHFQKAKPQGKLVRCISGEVYDVVADIDPDSKTFGKWFGCWLTGSNNHQIWIPPGYAHGFQVISETADIEYKVTDFYDPSSEGCLIWNDSDIGVEWPYQGEPVLSDKDRQGITLKELVESRTNLED